MGLIDKINKMAADARRLEESLYAIALAEVANEDIKPGLWAKAFADSRGNDAVAKAIYLKLRVQSLRDELAALDRKIQQFEADPIAASTPASAPVTETESPPASVQESASAGDAYDAIDVVAQPTNGWWQNVAVAILIVAIAVLIGYIGSQDQSSGGSRNEERTPADQPAASAAASSATPVTSEPTLPVQSYVSFKSSDQHALVPRGITEVATIAGPLQIRRASNQQRLFLNGSVVELPESFYSFLSITHYSSQDIVLVAMNCGGSACTYLDLAFLRLYARRPMIVETEPRFQFPGDLTERVQQGITLHGETIYVSLGLLDGQHRLASISPMDPLTMSAASAQIEPLSPDDCAMTMTMLDMCANWQTPCSDDSALEFPNNCPDAALPVYRAVKYLAHHTTGLNLPVFAATCTKASELGMTPSKAFVESDICSGADPTQWSAPGTRGIEPQDASPAMASPDTSAAAPANATPASAFD